MNSNFHYEHIGHMQFSGLTLNILDSVYMSDSANAGQAIKVQYLKERLLAEGYSEKLVSSEIDRMLYGFECAPGNSEGEVVLTSLGRSYVQSLLEQRDYQSSQVAILFRKAKKKDSFNVVIQDNGFYDTNFYETLNRYSFRNGPARDFLRCLSTTDFLSFIGEVVDVLSIAGPASIPSGLKDCLADVATRGKYWPAIKDKYLWYVFPQRYSLEFSNGFEEAYAALVAKLIRPPEWGGGKTLTRDELNQLLLPWLQCDLEKFVRTGIIRESSGRFQLTAPGYLMFERYSKGFIGEVLIRRVSEDDFLVMLCDAFDTVFDVAELEFAPSNSEYISHEVLVHKSAVIDTIRRLCKAVDIGKKNVNQGTLW